MAIGSKTLGPDQLDALDDDALAAELEIGRASWRARV